ncbi:MAG TPA: response regulator transcription factor [Bacteroidota bacterium]|nr:response regulator transcription factor [Bacteroidota bacterium]
MIKVLIADDHPIVREGLKQVIEKSLDMKVAGEALNGQEVLDHVYAEYWDVLILDFSMPGKSGLDVIKELRRERPSLPILVLSMHPEAELAPRLLKAGAAGYLTKESAPKELVNAIRKVHSGGRYVSPALAESLAEGLSHQSAEAPHQSLSDREYQVLLRIAAGRSVQDVATEFSLSVKTVRTYRERVMEKLSLKNDVELSRYALEHGLIPR